MARHAPSRQLLVVGGERADVWLVLRDSVAATVERLRREGPWRVLLVAQPPADWREPGRFAGVMFSSFANVGETLADAPMPVIDFHKADPAAAGAGVLVDEPAVGRLAARHLLERGYRRLATLRRSGSPRQAQRADGFVAEARQAGRPVAICTEFERTKDWVEQLARESAEPLGVFALSDDWAEWITSAMQSRGIAVPQSVGVVGVGDWPLANWRGCLPISSVQLPSAAIGIAAAEILLALLAGQSAPACPPLPPLRVISRETTSFTCSTDPVVAAALKYMTAHVSQPGEKVLATALGISVRQVRRRFQEALGTGPAVVWHRLQIEAAQDLLLQTSLKVSAIAPLAGYSGARPFIRAFKAVTGQPPDSWRRSNR
jgi:LacI family transcriptional regulator